MSFSRTRYIEWARRFYGKVRFDLATSGVRTVDLRELGVPEPAEWDDASGWTRCHDATAAHNDVGREEAIPTLGTTHALWLAYASLTEPGDDVLVEEPAYEPLLRMAEGVGARVVRFARDPSARFALDPDSVARAMTPRTRLVVVTDPHNPGGVRAGSDRLRATARVAETRGALLVVDEVYAELDEPLDPNGVFRSSARRLAPNIVTVSSLTKCYGLGPQRIGWLLGPKDVVARAEDAVVATVGTLPLLHAHVALRAFAQISVLASSARENLASRRDRVSDWVASQGLSWTAPRGGLFGFVSVPGRGDLTPILEAAAREREVLVAPGAFFGVPEGFRIAWSGPIETLDEGLARLAEALRPARVTHA